MFYLWYDNGTGWFDCASRHNTLTEAIVAAETGWQTSQHITKGPNGDVVWKNYREGVVEETEKSEKGVSYSGGKGVGI